MTSGLYVQNGHGGVDSSGRFQRPWKAGQNSILIKIRIRRISILKMGTEGCVRSLRRLDWHFYTGGVTKVSFLNFKFARVEAKSKMTKSVTSDRVIWTSYSRSGHLRRVESSDYLTRYWNGLARRKGKCYQELPKSWRHVAGRSLPVLSESSLLTITGRGGSQVTSVTNWAVASDLVRIPAVTFLYPRNALCTERVTSVESRNSLVCRVSLCTLLGTIGGRMACASQALLRDENFYLELVNHRSSCERKCSGADNLWSAFGGEGPRSFQKRTNLSIA